MNVLGLMTGTSADGVDAVLAAFGGPPERLFWRVVRHVYTPFPEVLRRRVLAAIQGEARVPEIARLHHDLGRFFVQVARGFKGVELAALMGQTIWHEPPRYTFQIGEGAHLAEALGVPVVEGFRYSDLAAGGEGAPLLPYPDLLLFGEEGVRRAVVNIGGIANVTYLPGCDPRGVLAFDLGPGNALIDEAAGRLGRPMDEGGRLAAAGRVDEAVLKGLLAHPFFRRPPPKSTGRELWNLATLELPEGLTGENLVATLTAFTAHAIALGLERFVLPRGLDEAWIAGGGAKNPVLVGMLKEALPVPVRTFEEATGLDASVREPLAVALLGYLRHLGAPSVLPQTTGARRAARAGMGLLPGVEGWP